MRSGWLAVGVQLLEDKAQTELDELERELDQVTTRHRPRSQGPRPTRKLPWDVGIGGGGLCD